MLTVVNKKDFLITGVKMMKENVILHKIHTTKSHHYGFVSHIDASFGCKESDIINDIVDGDRVCGHFSSEGFEYLLIGSVFSDDGSKYIHAEKIHLRTPKPLKTENLIGLSDKERTEYSKNVKL